MGLFRQSKEMKRIKSLENALGLFFVPADNKDEYNEHKVEEGGYEIIPRLKRDVKELQDKKKTKK